MDTNDDLAHGKVNLDSNPAPLTSMINNSNLTKDNISTSNNAILKNIKSVSDIDAAAKAGSGTPINSSDDDDNKNNIIIKVRKGNVIDDYNNNLNSDISDTDSTTDTERSPEKVLPSDAEVLSDNILNVVDTSSNKSIFEIRDKDTHECDKHNMIEEAKSYSNT